MQGKNKTRSGVVAPVGLNAVVRSDTQPKPREQCHAAHFDDGEELGNLHEEKYVNPVILIAISSVTGFGVAVISAALGSGLLMSFFIYLGVSIAGSLILLGLACLAARPTGDMSVAENALSLVEYEATETAHVIFARRQRIRLRLLITISVVIFTMMLADEMAIQIAVGAAGVLAWLWSLHDRAPMKSQRTAEPCKRAGNGK